jgi:uncharacterized protein (DUF433 family)
MVLTQIYNSGSKNMAEDGMDWSHCELVEINPKKVGGVPILKGTRVQADAIVENYEGGSDVEEIAENFEISAETVRKVLLFAGSLRELAKQ